MSQRRRSWASGISAGQTGNQFYVKKPGQAPVVWKAGAYTSTQEPPSIAQDDKLTAQNIQELENQMREKMLDSPVGDRSPQQEASYWKNIMPPQELSPEQYKRFDRAIEDLYSEQQIKNFKDAYNLPNPKDLPNPEDTYIGAMPNSHAALRSQGMSDTEAENILEQLSNRGEFKQ